jgi:hypothetical protein
VVARWLSFGERRQAAVLQKVKRGLRSPDRIGVTRHDRPRCPHPVNGRADDPAGIAGSFTAGVKPGDRRTLSTAGITDDPDGRAAAGLRPCKSGIAEESPAEPPVHERETGQEGLDNRFGEKLSQVSGRCAPAIAGRDRAPARSALEEIAGPLDRRVVRTSAGKIRELLEPLLVLDAGQRMRAASFVRLDRDDQAR